MNDDLVSAVAAEIASLSYECRSDVEIARAIIPVVLEYAAGLAEADADRSNRCYAAAIGGDLGKDRNAARYRTALRIAAAIRRIAAAIRDAA